MAYLIHLDGADEKRVVDPARFDAHSLLVESMAETVRLLPKLSNSS